MNHVFHIKEVLSITAVLSTAASVLQHAALQWLEVCSHEAAMDTLRRTVVRSCGLARQLGRQQGARSASSLHPHNQVATTRQPGTADCNLF